MSRTTALRRLSVVAPYWPCIRTLNISTEVQVRHLTQGPDNEKRHAPGLARTEFAAPAMEPAAAISLRERSGKGEMILFEIAYDVNKSEFTPAIPIKGLAMPV